MTPTPEIPEPHYIGHRQRLKKKFFKCGLQALHDYEAGELLLSYAIPRKDIKSLAKDLLERFGSLKGIMDAEFEELTAVRGISAHAAGLVRMVKEMSALYLQEKAREKPQISCTGELLDFCKTALGGLKDEISAFFTWIRRIGSLPSKRSRRALSTRLLSTLVR
jgi:DNA repair protein RadC